MQHRRIDGAKLDSHMLLSPQVWERFCGIAPEDVAIGLTGPPVYSPGAQHLHTHCVGCR